MAKIKNVMTGIEALLLPMHLIGRHALYPYTSLKGENLSRQHALMCWDGVGWLLEDTSANGTFLNKERIKKEQKIIIRQGDIVNFGSYDSWEVIDLTPPKCMLIPTDSEQEIVELSPSEPLHVLGNEGYTVFPSESGEWVFKSGQALTVLKHGSKVGGLQHTWTYVDAKPDSSTVRYFNYDENLSSSLLPRYSDESNNQSSNHIPSLEKLRQASLDISLFLYCHGMARQTTKKITGSIIKPLCKKDGGKPYGTIDINVWKAWLAGGVKFPQVDKLEVFCHYLLKEFPIIHQWLGAYNKSQLSLPLTIENKQQLIQVAESLRSRPRWALTTWQQQSNAHDIRLKFNTLPNEARSRACFAWLSNNEELCDVLVTDEY